MDQWATGRATGFGRLARALAGAVALAVTGWTATANGAAGYAMQVRTEGSSFSPSVACEIMLPQLLTWTWSDSTISKIYPVTTKNFGSIATRNQFLTVVPSVTISKINLGFDGSDNGWTNKFGNRPGQNVSAVMFPAPLTGLQFWASSYNPITNTLNFSGFTSLQDIECFHCSPLQHVRVTNLPSLRRVCFEDCDLQELDLRGLPNLEDVRGALNDMAGVTIGGGTGPKIWHWCFRDNPQITQDFSTFMTNFYSLKEPWFWNANQGGALKFVSTNLTDVEVFGNHFTSADFSNQKNMFELLIHENSLTNLTIKGCSALELFDAHDNQLPSAVLDAILAELDLNCPAVNYADLTMNAQLPSDLGYAHYVNLLNRGVDVRVDSPPPNPTYPVITVASTTLLSEGLLPTNNLIDAGEPVTVQFTLTNSGSANATNVTVRLLSGNGVSSPTGPQQFGVISAGGGVAQATFTFVATGQCGGAIVPTLQVEEGAGILTKIRVPFRLGNPVVVFSRTFDGLVPPAIAPDWTRTNTAAQSPWVTDNTLADTAPNSVTTPDGTALGTATLTSPLISIPTNTACLLTFRNAYDLEADLTPYVGYDGGVLEIQVGTNAFKDIIAAGGSFVTGGYNRKISTNYQSAIAGRLAWSGHSGGFITTTVQLPASAAGKTIKLRWKAAMDIGSRGGGWDGWRIDSLSITRGSCSTTPTPPVIQSVTTSNNVATVTWSSIPSRKYRLQYTGSYNGTTWTNIPPDVTATNYTASATDSSGATQRFYRVVLLP